MPLGYYVTIGGGVIHKDGLRNDLDLCIVARKMDRPVSPREDMVYRLRQMNVRIVEDKGWIIKATWEKLPMDLRIVLEQPWKTEEP